jgi:Ring finger domain
MEYMSDRYGRNEGTRLTSSNSAGQQQQQETLHGRDRRHAYEQLRRQMMARASGGILTQENIASSFPLQPPNLNFPATNTTNVTRSDSIQQRIKNSLSRLCGSLLDAAFISEGPHEVPNLGPTTTTYSVAAWLIRLHLAQYLITGNCPTIFHRMLGLRLKRNSGDSTISARPNLQRLIGVLILAQGSSTFVRNTVNWLATGVARILEQRHQRIQSSQGGSPQRTLDKELAYYFGDAITGDHVEQFDHTGTASTDCPSTDLKSSQIGFMDKQHEQQTNLVCTICRMERLHPAAPVSCGHVCCWNCLMQWVQNVRPECPLCRAPCRPQEIIALHHYEPDTAKESPGIF